MKSIAQTIRKPVKRAEAENNLLTTMLVFAASVVATRLFLQITGYPKLGNDVLHIAHALWGGLFLMVSAILPIILANRWVFNLSAVLNGLGIGLFIDEVGKFITANNDYFYPPAAPLIYASFLMLVLVYFFVRRSKNPEPRSALYHALADLQELADDNLDPLERDLLLERLAVARTSDQPHIAGLAESIETYLKTSDVPLVPVQPRFSKQAAALLRSFGEKFGRKPFRLINSGSYVAYGFQCCLFPRQSGMDCDFPIRCFPGFHTGISHTGRDPGVVYRSLAGASFIPGGHHWRIDAHLGCINHSWQGICRNAYRNHCITAFTDGLAAVEFLPGSI